MGKLVALNTNNEEKKLKTEQPTATIVAQGQRGKLMQTGSASAPVSSPPTVYRTSPVKTTPVTQQNVVTPKMPAQSGASPMLRRQNVVTPKWQSPIMQGLNSGALQQQNAKPYQSKEALEQHVKDVKPQTVAQRVGNTLKGAAKTYGAGFANLSGVSAQGQGGTAMSPVYRAQAETLDQQIAALEATLSDPSMTAQDIADTKEAIAIARSEREKYGKIIESGERAAVGAYDIADRLADSGAKDISKAKRDLGGAGRLAVDVGVAGTQMGMDMALAPFMGGSALFPMFMRSTGGSAQEARRQGATHEQQVNYGFASGALSVATEKIGNAAGPFRKMFGKGFLDDVIERTMGNLTKSTAGKLVLSFLEEGGEEVLEDLVQPALQMIYNGKTLGGSYSELEAAEVLNDFLVGGILGGLGGGVEALTNRGYYDSRTELPQGPRSSDADVVNGISDRLFARYNDMIGENGRKAMRGSYQEGKDTAQHVADFLPAYNAGVEGKANPNPTSETAYAGYVAGQNDAKAEARKKTFAQENEHGSGLVYDEYVAREMNSTTADEINTVAKALGVRVRMADEVRGGTANGVIEGNEIRIAKDAQDPVMQVVGHEWTHRVQDLAPEQYTAFRSAIMENGDVAEAAKILYEQYNRRGVEISMEQAMDEAAANYAGEMISNTDVLNEFIRRHSADRTLLEKLRDAIREIVGKLTGKAKQQAQTAEGLLQQAFEAAAQNSKNAATEGGVRFMFAGENATNANKESLSTAKEMEKGGTDAETIRQKTGWFRGADGKWRWEIDDSDMKLRFESGLYDYDTELREKTHAWDRLTNRELTDEQRRDLADYQRSTERGEADEALYEKLTREFGGDFEKWALTLETMKEAAKSIPNYTTLGELVDAPALFATYPDMKNMDVTFQNLERGQNGGYSRRFDSIELSRDLKNRPEALLNSLTHEVQHAIQQREGFTPGANLKYWNRKLEEGYDGRDAETRREGARLREQYEQMKANDPEFMRSMEELNAMAPTVPRGKVDMDTWEQVEPDPPEWVRFDERRDQLEEKYGDRVWDYFSLRDSIDRNARDSRLPGALYRDTAGEIEARDAAARRGLTVEERRNRKPDTGDENTVFADGRKSYSIDPYFSENVREWYEEGQNAGERFTLGSTGDVLQGLGAIESDIYMNGDKISRILSDHPEMTIEEIRRIPELLEDPVLILKSKGRGASKANSRVVLYGTMKAQNGEPVMAVLDLRPSENGFVLDDMQKVNSAYTKKNPANFVAGSDVLYADKKRTVPLLRQFGLTITSRELLRNGSIGSISYENGVVKLDGVPLSEVTGENVKRYSLKTDSEGRDLTEQQQEYFKGSEVRDEDGRLIPVYHGSQAQFTEFSADFMSMHGSMEGQGFYFTDNRSMAEGYKRDGGQLLEGYLNIAKPLSDSEVTMTKAELKKLLKAVDPTGDDVVINYDPAGGMGYPSKAWYNRALAATVEQIYSTSDSDSEILADVANSGAGAGATTKAARKALGYDGYIVKGKYGDATVYVAFESNQFKNADNKSPTVDQDIRHSLKGTENAQEIAALKRENETLRERVDYWKGQTRRSDGVRTDSKSVEKAAKELTRRYGAEIEGSEIAGDLANLYDYIARGGDETGELTYTEARSRADAIAQRIAESAIAKDDEVYRTYGELRKYLKDTKITLSSEDAAAITDYADFRRGLFGKVNLGKGEHTNVDQVYSELAESYPEFFSETRENNVSDQIARIADVANELYSVSEYNPFEGYMGQAVSAISNDIMERFFDLPQAKKTFADVQAEKLDAAKAAGRKAAADAKLAGQMAQGRTDAIKLRRTQEALQKARAQQAEKLDALRNRYREKDTTRREKQANRELRAKITRHAKDLSQKLLRPTDKRHIPEEMRSSVAAVLNSINQESAYTVDESGKRVYDGSGTPTQRTEAFRALQGQYKSILKNDEGGDMVIDPSLLGTDGSDGLLEQVISMKDKRLSELTREELGTLWKTIRAVEKSVSTAGKVLSKSKFETTTQMADSFKNDLRTRRKKLGNNTSISLETPYTFFAHYGETGKSIYRMLRDAQDHQEVMARDVAGKVQLVLGDELSEAGFKDIAGKAIHGDLKGALRDARGSAIGKWEAETHDITVANGGKLTLTTPQIMELYLLSKRKQALGHLLGGGVIQPEIKSAETGRTKVPRGTQQVFLTDGDIERITGMLTDEQKRVADGLQSLTATTLANYGNEASMKAYGYRKFTERNYWPIKSAREGVHSNLEKDSGNVRSIKNIGMAQQVQQNANNAVELHSAFDTFAEHASDMIDYAAWLTTMEDLNRFYNYQYRNDAGLKTGVNVKGLLDEKGGKGSQQYWQKLMGDIQNGIVTKDFEPITGKMGKFVGKFKGAAVGANIRVVIQQPTAFFRAAAVLDPKDMAKGVTGGVTKGNGWEKAMQYSPTAMRKDVGSFDISSPYTLQERFYGKEGVTNKLNDLAGAAAGKADAVTWGKLWNACEWQVKREKPDVRAGSNEFYHAVNEAFTDMIDQTQVVDGILQRSNIMRGKSTLSQQATAFMGEPIMSLNVLMRSYDNFRYEENPAKRSKALKTLGRAATALVVTNVVNALAQSIVDGLRDDDRDKDYWEKFLSAFTGAEGDEESAWEVIQNVVLNGNIGDNMNPIGQIPFAKDILSLAQGYDVSRPDMEVFADMIKAGQTFIKSIDGSGKKTRKEATLGLIAAASKMFGLPAANIKRDLMATLRTIAQASGSLGFQYEVEKFSYNLANSGNRSRFIGILYDALEQGDYATYEHVRRELMEQMGLNGESIQSSLKERYKKRLEADGGYTLPKKALDILGVREKYAESEEKEAKFSAKDLDAGTFSRYEAQRTDTYRKAEEKATGSGAFQMLSDEGKDKALSYANTYAEETALASTAGGKYEIATKWVQEAQEAQQKYRIDPGVFAACRAAASECKTLKDRDGKAIDKSRGMQIMEMLFRSGLNEQQRKAMYEYLGVPENMRHWNRARVDEQLKIARRKAA